jgi:hypothetical protein
VFEVGVSIYQRSERIELRTARRDVGMGRRGWKGLGGGREGKRRVWRGKGSYRG